MYCKNCNYNLETRTICPACGHDNSSYQDINSPPNNSNWQNIGYSTAPGHAPVNNDQAGIGIKIIAFISPIVGIILYFALKAQTPQKAKSIGTTAIFSIIIRFTFVAINYSILFAAMFASQSSQLMF